MAIDKKASALTLWKKMNTVWSATSWAQMKRRCCSAKKWIEANEMISDGDMKQMLGINDTIYQWADERQHYGVPFDVRF